MTYLSNKQAGCNILILRHVNGKGIRNEQHRQTPARQNQRGNNCETGKKTIYNERKIFTVLATGVKTVSFFFIREAKSKTKRTKGTKRDYRPNLESLPVAVAVLGCSLFHVRYVWSPSFLQCVSHHLCKWVHVGYDIPWFNQMGKRKDRAQNNTNATNDDIRNSHERVLASNNRSRSENDGLCTSKERHREVCSSRSETVSQNNKDRYILSTISN